MVGGIQSESRLEVWQARKHSPSSLQRKSTRKQGRYRGKNRGPVPARGLCAEVKKHPEGRS